jgi:hypothetical protein
MSEDVSRGKALSQLALGLALTLTENEAGAETYSLGNHSPIGTEMQRHQPRARRHQGRAGQPATAPAKAPAEFQPTKSCAQYQATRQ